MYCGYHVGYNSIYAISAQHTKNLVLFPPNGNVFDTTVNYVKKFDSHLNQICAFLSSLVSSGNKTDCHKIYRIMAFLKVKTDIITSIAGRFVVKMSIWRSNLTVYCQLVDTMYIQSHSLRSKGNMSKLLIKLKYC